VSADTFSLNELKVAVLNKDLKALETLSAKKPSFSSIEEAKEMDSYIQEALKILKKEKLNIFKEMEKIKKLKEFKNNNPSEGLSLKI